ncbi:MAG: hypothetical protein Kow00124_17830 [Anaerolineae bacterium]
MKITLTIDEQTYEVEIENPHARPVIARVNGERFEVWPQPPAPTPVVPSVGAPAGAAPAERPVPRPLPAPPPRTAPAESGRAIHAPIPGVIDKVSVQAGSVVKRGQELCVLEAMKMKNAIRAPRDGLIAVVHISVGQHVRHHEVLMEYADQG